MRQNEKTKLHILLLLSAFTLGLGFRLVRLGVPALSDHEAAIALQALGAARHSDVLMGSHVAYVGLTGLSFFIFQASNFLARFWQAFIGALLVFVPFFFREKIGYWQATILAFIFAVSPELVGLSRLIGSPMTAMVFLLFTLAFLSHHKPVLLGLTLALGLMSGEGFWHGVFILGLSYLIARWFFDVSDTFLAPSIRQGKHFWLRSGLSFLTTLLIVGTGFFLSPEGLSGIFSGFVSFIRGFVIPGAVPFVVLPMALIAYSGGAVIFGVWGSLHAILKKNKIDLFLLGWWLVGLAFLFLYPGAVTGDLIWVSFPLWVLSARVICHVWRLPDRSRFVMVVTAVLVVAVAAFLLFATRSMVRNAGMESDPLNTFLALIGGVVLLVVIILLVSYGWTEDVAFAGLILGLAVVFSVGLITVSVNSTGLAPEPSFEIWYPNEGVISSEWLDVSIDRVYDWNALSSSPVEIAVSDYDMPGMRWFMRDRAPVYFVPYLAPQSEPAMLITDIQEIPGISSGYRGQDLIWSRRAAWEEMTSFDYFSWFLTRDVPDDTNEIIFWVRTDLMPDGEFTP